MSVLELGAAFGIGLAATVSPCALPLYPGFLAYLAARSGEGSVRGTGWLGLAVLAGVLTMMLAIGALIAALQVAVGRVLVVVTPLADVVVIGFGIALLLGRNPFARLPALARGGGTRGPLVSAYVYGLMYGPIAIPCSGSLLVAIFTLSLTVTDFAEKLTFFLAFGLGFGIPLLAISLVAAGRSAALLRVFARNYGVIARVAGVVLVAVGLYDLSNNLPAALLYLS
jgi:cytochrome c-type biogenesis protein